MKIILVSFFLIYVIILISYNRIRQIKYEGVSLDRFLFIIIWLFEISGLFYILFNFILKIKIFINA